jgi:hypothetical protein
MSPLASLLIAASLGLVGWRRANAQGFDDFEQEPIRYSATAPNDAVQKLEARIRAGEVRLAGGAGEVVRALLGALNVPPESQTLVFSRTSFQRDRISPTRPRALYFSDDVYVGWVPGGLVEVACIDPQLGPVFYRFDPDDEPAPAAPRFVRDETCLSCHGGQFVRGIPGVFVRSVHVDAQGDPLLRFGTTLVDERTPFAELFGGWYVTGTHGSARHRGNVVERIEKEQLVAEHDAGIDDLAGLAGRVDLRDYLASGSDLVALLVLEHQLTLHNRITRAGFDCRRLMRYQTGVQRDLHETVTDVPTYESVRGVFDRAARDVVDGLLGKDVAPLPDGGVAGDPAFQSAYLSQAKRDAAGDSLRDFDLKTRLFRNRCSPLIDGDSFAALPEQLRTRIYAKLAAALRSGDADPRYAYLEAPERARIVAILRETHRGLPAGWTADG